MCCSDRLCDYLFEPYPAWYQQAWQAGELWKLSVHDAQVQANGSTTAAALHQYPPVLSAAIWAAMVSDLLCHTVGI